jgi:proline dehydrogenase
MLDAASKAVFHLLAQSHSLQKLATRFGMRKQASLVHRFVPGETVEDAIRAARVLEANGLTETFDHLGENVTSLAEAEAATRDYLAVARALIESGVERNISLKLTQLGLDVDRASAVDHMRKILELAEPAGFFIRIDMESSRYTGVTLDIFETLWQQGYRSIGVVLQSDLYRSEEDLKRINALGARIRLVKGAYREPKSVAYQKKTDVDAAYVRMMKVLLATGQYPAIATHDLAMLDSARQFARENALSPERFEFQMLYGIRRDLQSSLVKEGYRVRVYIPFGRDWFPYFMRRLGERPANVTFVLRGLLGEKS